MWGVLFLSNERIRGSNVMQNLITRFIEDESGATAIEYGLIAALIAVGMIAGATSIGTKVNTKFNDIATTVSTGTASGTAG